MDELSALGRQAAAQGLVLRADEGMVVLERTEAGAGEAVAALRRNWTLAGAKEVLLADGRSGRWASWPRPLYRDACDAALLAALDGEDGLEPATTGTAAAALVENSGWQWRRESKHLAAWPPGASGATRLRLAGGETVRLWLPLVPWPPPEQAAARGLALWLLHLGSRLPWVGGLIDGDGWAGLGLGLPAELWDGALIEYALEVLWHNKGLLPQARLLCQAQAADHFASCFPSIPFNQ